MFGTGTDSFECNAKRRRCSLIRVPSPADRGSAAECADMVPAGIDGCELTFGRVKLPVIVLSPTGDTTVNLDSAGKSKAGSDLLELHAIRNVQLPVFTRAPTLNSSVILQGARMILASRHLDEHRRIGLVCHVRTGDCCDGRGTCSGGVHHSRPKHRLLDCRPLVARWRWRRGVRATDQTDCAYEQREDCNRAAAREPWAVALDHCHATPDTEGKLLPPITVTSPRSASRCGLFHRLDCL